jgi:hydrogenase-4 component E
MLTLMSLLLFLLVLTNLTLLGSSRLAFCIRTVALQGAVLGLIPLVGLQPLTIQHFIFSLTAVVMKGGVFPWLLFRSLRVARVKREVEPFIGFSISLSIGFFALIGSVILASRLPFSGDDSRLIVALALFTMVTGLLLLVSRRKALSMVLGYLVLENGIYGLGIVVADHIPMVVEFGVLLDVWVAVFGMGIAMYQINREFDHTDVDRLRELKG